MWKEKSQFLLVDEKIWETGIPLVSACNCCEARQEEMLDHVLSNGEATSMVWRKMASYFRLLNTELEP